jgi:hypothetical protein
MRAVSAPRRGAMVGDGSADEATSGAGFLMPILYLTQCILLPVSTD